jgi:hypothetical protein
MVDGLPSVLMNPIQGFVFLRIAFFALATWVFAGERLNALVSAAQDFSVEIKRATGFSLECYITNPASK